MNLQAKKNMNTTLKTLFRFLHNYGHLGQYFPNVHVSLLVRESTDTDMKVTDNYDRIKNSTILNLETPLTAGVVCQCMSISHNYNGFL